MYKVKYTVQSIKKYIPDVSGTVGFCFKVRHTELVPHMLKIKHTVLSKNSTYLVLCKDMIPGTIY